MNISELKNKLGAFQFYFLLLVVLLLVLYGGFHLGNKHYSQQQKLVATQQHSIENLKLENETLTKNLNILGVELEVAKLAEQQHFSEMQEALDRENTLKTQLAFYQQVMAPELKEQGFLIEGFQVEPALSERSYRFELALMQQDKTKNIVKGSLRVTLLGSEKGQAKQYSMNKLLSEPERESLKFSFKYFQVIEGQIKLPEGFQPEKVSVHAEVYQFKRKKGELTSVFDWVITTTE